MPGSTMNVEREAASRFVDHSVVTPFEEVVRSLDAVLGGGGACSVEVDGHCCKLQVLSAPVMEAMGAGDCCRRGPGTAGKEARDQALDQALDQARDQALDQGLDQALDQPRDQDRAQGQDQARDQARDQALDQPRDQPRDQEVDGSSLGGAVGPQDYLAGQRGAALLNQAFGEPTLLVCEVEDGLGQMLSHARRASPANTVLAAMLVACHGRARLPVVVHVGDPAASQYVVGRCELEDGQHLSYSLVRRTQVVDVEHFLPTLEDLCRSRAGSHGRELRIRGAQHSRWARPWALPASRAPWSATSPPTREQAAAHLWSGSEAEQCPVGVALSSVSSSESGDEYWEVEIQWPGRRTSRGVPLTSRVLNLTALLAVALAHSEGSMLSNLTKGAEVADRARKLGHALREEQQQAIERLTAVPPAGDPSGSEHGAADAASETFVGKGGDRLLFDLPTRLALAMGGQRSLEAASAFWGHACRHLRNAWETCSDLPLSRTTAPPGTTRTSVRPTHLAECVQENHSKVDLSRPLLDQKLYLLDACILCQRQDHEAVHAGEGESESGGRNGSSGSTFGDPGAPCPVQLPRELPLTSDLVEQQAFLESQGMAGPWQVLAADMDEYIRARGLADVGGAALPEGVEKEEHGAPAMVEPAAVEFRDWYYNHDCGAHSRPTDCAFDDLWVRTFDHVRYGGQRRTVFEPGREAEKVLHYLETAPATHLVSQCLLLVIQESAAQARARCEHLGLDTVACVERALARVLQAAERAVEALASPPHADVAHGLAASAPVPQLSLLACETFSVAFEHLETLLERAAGCRGLPHKLLEQLLDFTSVGDHASRSRVSAPGDLDALVSAGVGVGLQDLGRPDLAQFCLTCTLPASVRAREAIPKRLWCQVSAPPIGGAGEDPPMCICTYALKLLEPAYC